MQIEASELQGHLLKMVKQFHEMCEKHNFQYYILGGTCLGARRHGGFIPWDDDIDVGMPREDYERFCNLKQEELPDHLELRYYRTTKDSPFHFVKLVDNTTTLIEHAYRNYVEGVYIDVFPLDGAKDYAECFCERMRCRRIWFEKVMILYNCMTDTRSNFAKKMLIAYAKKKDLYKMHMAIDKKMKKYAFSDSDFVANFYGAWAEKEIHAKSIYGKPVLYQFEDTKLYGPEKIDAYLKGLYGDFMKLPPENQRVFKHDYYYVNLDKGFREYTVD